ncbi:MULTISPECIES: hybrid sensor histidine kinase/response regulator [Bradyrhizobium]|uniref:histidine kinase n=1 Tax=Bradyrhizobium diazoefficiens (strain JCM 10833 / BCRC 13528 / IAM 13628 / NBRC 14792 / USDA 110) TaxID=224911 RepID=Q89Q81_BRADU|nr:hybrid sensor histidine kinase/response regulator [Bradyrhizobium diazoefficiens]MBP1066802.1 signal transduction histidine kinase/CheY-like chemotaxis protein/HPt (histidine-containing phosphotransfer) domain-containing protein [Bradyrhizobium japonicum]AND88681.1 ATPase [Bradyrhizobium diazoefficiens USDA 110]AWO90235.1 response regulator [Bradyrhizobium diazoefficiens]PDT63114.1 ATPase [Bradyrhizobium diazoefficiens]QBP22054.1 hybrid sensor histidine kinase/response regulator [Bradyrhizo
MNEQVDQGHLRTPPGRLFRKYLYSIVALAFAALAINTGFDVWFSYREQKQLLAATQREQAASAAIQIGQFIGQIENQIRWLSRLPPELSTNEDERLNAIRLLRLSPAIAEIAELDAQGREQVRVSRRVADRVGSKIDLSASPAFRGANESRTYYGPVYFIGDTEPFMTLAARGVGRGPNVIVAEVNLRFIWDLVAGIRVGNTGKAYVVDRMGLLIAHPDLWPALRRSDLSGHADVRAALDGAGPPSGGLVKEDLSGQRVLSTYATVPSLGWLVFVELPLTEAYAPIYASIGRSTFLLVALLACAVLVSLFLSRRMTVPIQILTQGARRIGSGDLGLRLAIKTGDELEALGDQFNRMAAHLRESYATLERKVIERTSELEKARDHALAEHDAAERARSIAVQANETKSRFLAVVSHELRTPLNGVMGVLQLLDDGSLGEAQRRHLATAAASGETLIALVDAILEYARLEASAETLEMRDFRLDQLIEAAADLMRPQAFGKGLTFDLASDVTVNTSVHGDPVRLNRILLNLIGNAIKFTPRGGIGLKASAEQHEDHILLSITVRDTGIGIAPDMHERIFEDFVQADDSIARRFGGTGLGLAIARRLTRLMRGELTVESTPGAGSTFALEVPLGLAASGIAQGALPPPSRRLRVLLVDDDPVNCQVGEAILNRLGHHPTIARNGASAVALARDQAFDIILMDLHMPDMDGVEAASQIGKLGLPRMPRIIAVTADVSRSARERLASAGIAKVVSKPILINALREAIEDDPPDQPAEVRLAAGALIDRHFLDDQKELLGATQIAKLHQLLRQTSQQRIEDIAEAAAIDDHLQLARSAHQLGSAASALGLVRLFERCREVELAVATMSASECHGAARELAALQKASMSALDELLLPVEQRSVS